METILSKGCTHRSSVRSGRDCRFRLSNGCEQSQSCLTFHSTYTHLITTQSRPRWNDIPTCFEHVVPLGSIHLTSISLKKMPKIMGTRLSTTSKLCENPRTTFAILQSSLTGSVFVSILCSLWRCPHGSEQWLGTNGRNRGLGY